MTCKNPVRRHSLTRSGVLGRFHRTVYFLEPTLKSATRRPYKKVCVRSSARRNMRTGPFAAVAVLSTLAIGCGGGNGSRLQHPTLDQDYADRFVGTWDGTATLAIHGQPTQAATGTQRIGRTGFNRLAVAQVCPGVDGPAGLDSATTFSMDPVVCPAVNQSCGPVTLRWESGIGNLAQDTLTMTLEGTASGCGQSLAFTVTFTGRLLGGPDGGAPDGGAPDGGAPDGGAPDGGAPDGGAPDGGAPPSGAPPSGAPPSGAPPSGAPPSGAPPSGAPPSGPPSNRPVNVTVKAKLWPHPEAVPSSVIVSVSCARFPIPLSHRSVTGPQD